MRAAIRVHGYSRRAEKAYVAWIRRFVPQNQTLSAILFLYRKVLKIELGWLDHLVQARRPSRLPVVLTRPRLPGFSII